MDGEKLGNICKEIIREGSIKTTFGSMVDIILHADKPNLFSKEDERFLKAIETLVKK